MKSNDIYNQICEEMTKPVIDRKKVLQLICDLRLAEQSEMTNRLKEALCLSGD
jgi:hypothetical protein